jgi:hypothetical protein
MFKMFLLNAAAKAAEAASEGIKVEFKGVDPLIESFKYMGLGMLGIFIVTILLIMFISILNKAGSLKQSDNDEEE